jgi:hypothetical protein
LPAIEQAVRASGQDDARWARTEIRQEENGMFVLERIAARPREGYAYYAVGEHRGRFSALRRYFEPNRTLMIEVRLQRHVLESVFRLTQDLRPQDFRQP